MEPNQPEVINNLDYKARSVLILGVKRTGKSTLAFRLIDSHPVPLVLIYDWQGAEFSRRLGVRPLESREAVGQALRRGDRIICYAAEKGETKETLKGEGFEWFCDMAFEIAGHVPGRKLFCVDECQALIDPYTIPEPLSRILDRGGRRMMDTCLIGSSANALHTESRNQISEVYVFRCIDENAVKYPKSIGMDPDQIRALPDCRFVFWEARTGNRKTLDLWDGKSNPKEEDI